MVRLFQWRKKIRRFAKAKRGAVAVEFGLVAIPFFMLMMGTVEVAVMGLAQNSLDFAVSNAGREIRTGRAQQNGVTQTEIYGAVCEEINNFMLLECDAKLYLDVRNYPSFVNAAAGTLSPIDNAGLFQPGGFSYAPGVDSDIVVVRAFYRWTPVTPLFGRIFANTAASERILVSTMMFRNEPFGVIS